MFQAAVGQEIFGADMDLSGAWITQVGFLEDFHEGDDFGTLLKSDR